MFQKLIRNEWSAPIFVASKMSLISKIAAFLLLMGVQSIPSHAQQMTQSGLSATPAPMIQIEAPPTLTIKRTPSTLIAGQPYTFNWTTNAGIVYWDCSANGTGFSGSGELVGNSGTINGIADAAWVGYPSTCTYTAENQYDITTKQENLVTDPAPPPPLPAPTCNTVTAQSGSTTALTGTFRIYAYGVTNASAVRFPTWGDSGGQDDLIWYSGVNAGGGTWYADVNLANHKAGNPEFGNFNSHVYASNANNSESICGGTTWIRTQPLVNNAQFISQSAIPTSLVTGQTSAVSITMKNTGTTTWAANSVYKLGSQNPQDNTTWAIGRVIVGTAVLPEASYKFSFTIKAPATAGTYNFQWQMLEEGQAWFGGLSTNASITIKDPAPTCSAVTPISSSTSAISGGFRITATGVTNATSVQFPTWGNTGWQDDLVWYQGTNAGGGIWYADINLANHKTNNPEFGVFYTDVYAANANASTAATYCASTTWTRTASATALKVTINPSVLTLAATGPGIKAGAIVANPVDGTAPYTYSWTHTGSRSSASSTTINNPTISATLLAGDNFTEVWTVTVKDAVNATATATVNVTFTAPGGTTPILTVFPRVPSPMIAGQNQSVNWSSSNATSVSYKCTAEGTGFVGEGTVALNGPTAPGLALPGWVGFPSDCTWTATGPGGVTKVKETLFTVANNGLPVALLNTSAKNVQVATGASGTVTLTGLATNGTGQVSKIELFQDSGAGYGTTPVQTITGPAVQLNLNYSFTAAAGTYRFKLKSTGSNNVVTESSFVLVNIIDSTLKGIQSGVRSNASGTPILYGWVCQDSSASAVNYVVSLNAPLAMGGTQVATGTANLSTEVDNADIQAQCHIASGGRSFNVDLSSLITDANNFGRRLYVQASLDNGIHNFILPCNDSCNVPTGMSMALATPIDGDRYLAPATVFMQAKLANGTGPYDEIAFSIDGVWSVGTPDVAANTYYANQTGLAARAAPYIVMARVRQGGNTLYTVANRIYVDPVSQVTIALGSPSNGASATAGSAISLSATTGGVGTVTSVKFYANGNLIGTGVNSGGTWTTQWSNSTIGTYVITARAFSGTGSLLAISATASLTINNGSQGATSSDPIAVNITPPHLGNADAGTLPGSLNVGNDGAASYSIALVVPPGTAGMQPNLSLNYSSLGGNGMVGLGWSLSGLSSIHRCAKTIAQDGMPGRISFDNADRLCLDGQRLIRVDGANPGTDVNAIDAVYWSTTAQYRTEIESFSRITRLANNGFKVEAKDGRIHYYGTDANSAIPAQGRSDGQALLWALARTEDRVGNYQAVDYIQDANTGEYLPKHVRYGGNVLASQATDLAVRFSYELRGDAQIQYMGGARNDLRNRLTHVQTYLGTAADGSGGTLVRDHTLHYVESASSGRSLVDSMQACATNTTTNVLECLPKTSFDWGVGGTPAWKNVPIDSSPWPLFSNGQGGEQFEGNLDGSGRTSFITVQGLPRYPTGAIRARLSNGQIIDRSIPLLASIHPETMWVGDLDGDGRDDLVFPMSSGGVYCLTVPSPDGTIDFSCQNLPNTHVETFVDLRNDKKMHLVSFNSSDFTDCQIINNVMGCNTLPVRGDIPAWIQDPRYRSRPFPIDLSKQGMSDFSRIYHDGALGIGYVNTCNNSQSGISCKNIAVIPANNSNGPYLSNTSNVGDLNGDGLTDFTYMVFNWGSQRTIFGPHGESLIGSDLVTTTYECLSKENAMDCKQDMGLAAYSNIAFDGFNWPTSDDKRQILADFTGDGINRLFFVYKPNPADLSSAKSVLCRYTVAGFLCQDFAYSEAGNYYSKAAFLDDSGVPALLTSQPFIYPGWTAVSLVTSPAADRVIGVTNGIGQREEVDYARGDDATVYHRYATIDGVEQHPSYPQIAVSPGVMAKRLRHSNGQGGWLRNDYYYEGAMTDALGRGGLGFTKIKVTDVQRQISVESLMAQAYPYIGKIKRSASSFNGCTLSNTVNTLNQKFVLQANGTNTIFPYMESSEVDSRDLDCSDLGKSATGNEYSPENGVYWGNLTKQSVTLSGANKSLMIETTNTFNNYSSNWLIGLPSTVSTRKTNVAGTSLTRNASFNYDSQNGLLLGDTVEPGNLQYQIASTYSRAQNVFGLVNNKTQVWLSPDPAIVGNVTRSVNTTYDPKGRYASSTTNALGHQEFYTYDPATGARLSLKGPNALTTNWVVNGFGRVTKETRADGNETRSFVKACGSDCPFGATVAQITDSFHGSKLTSPRISVPQVLYLDSVGHVRRTQSWGFDGSAIVIDQRYDDLGRLSETDQPRVVTDNAYLASHQDFDELNRVIKIITKKDRTGDAVSLTRYHGFVTTLTNPLLQVREDARNVAKQLEQVKDAMLGLTTFEYEPFGNLSKTIDPKGNIIRVGYDTYGRKTSLTDPDLGLIEYSVDPIGLTWKQISPNQRAPHTLASTGFTYDLLGRMTARTETDLKSFWVYDFIDLNNATNKGIGQLHEAYTQNGSLKDYSRVYTYDGLSRPILTTQIISLDTFNSQTDFDIWGRSVTQTYWHNSDARKVFGRRYNNTGFLYRIERGNLPLWQVNNQDAAHRPTSITLGNGLIQTRRYDLYSGRMDAGNLNFGNTPRVQEGYHYDALGSVLDRTQYWDADLAQVGFDEVFTYDNLNRLATSTIQPYMAQAAQSQTFAYDAIGNLTNKTNVGANGLYTYLQARPHAVQSIATVPGTFSYDDNGNLLSGAGRTVTWSSFNMPMKIRKGSLISGLSSAFVYGPEHQRTRQNKGLAGYYTLYGGAQELETGSTGATIKTYWPGGIGVEIDRPNVSSTELDWTHLDRLGSPIAITGQDGLLKEKLAYDAWGKRRNLTDSGTPDTTDGVIDNKGFTGHEMLDQLDLVHMNGRIYDPLTARFLSGDPFVQEPTNGQSYNRYSYVLNNPTNLTDPTGFLFMDPFASTGGQYGELNTDYSGAQTNVDKPDKKTEEKGAAKDRTSTQGSLANSQATNIGRREIVGQTIAQGTNDKGTMQVVINTTHLSGPEGRRYATSNELFMQWLGFNPIEHMARGLGANNREAFWIGVGATMVGNPKQFLSSGINKVGQAWKGAGPIAGTIGVSPATESVKALQNFFPGNGVEFVFDAVTSTFVVGNGTMKHSPLAASIGADTNFVVGGIFGRGTNGSILTNEGSGHFWQNWTPEIRQQYVDFMKSKGVDVIHSEGK